MVHAKPGTGDWSKAVEAAAEFNTERDWGQFHDPKSLVLALVGEVGELAEHFQWLSVDEGESLKDDPQRIADIAGEISDIFIYLSTLANRLNIDIPTSTLAKLKLNAERFPVHKVRGRKVRHRSL